MTANLALLEDKFGAGIVNQPHVQSEIHSILRIYKLSVEEFYDKWELYDMKSEVDDSSSVAMKDKVTVERLKDFRDSIQRDLERDMSLAASKKALQTPVRTVKKVNRFGSSPSMSGYDFENKLLGTRKRDSDVPSSPAYTPPAKLMRTTETSSPAAVSSLGLHIPSSPVPASEFDFAARSDKGSVVQVLNSELNESAELNTEETLSSKITVVPNVDLAKTLYRPMYQKLFDAAGYLHGQLDDMIPEILAFHGLGESSVGNPSVMSQEEIVAIGRIVPESSTEDKLSRGSIGLESCRRFGFHSRVKLSFKDSASFQFFPGQIVALKGINASGNYFSVSEILDLPLLGPAAHDRNDSVSVWAASGPYSIGLDYSPLDALLKLANEEKPKMLILMGPFVDLANPIVAQGMFRLQNNDNGTLDDLFREQVSPRLRQINKHTQLLIVPHTRDAVSAHAAYPQPPLGKSLLDIPKSAVCMPNPCTFTLNSSVAVTVSTADVINDLTRTTVKQNSGGRSFFGSTVNAILSQRSLYPITPSVPSSSIDVPHMDAAEISTALPDVLILPSVLKASAQIVENVVAVNPGLLVKSGAAGHYAKINVIAGDGIVPERTKVEIVKI